MKIKVIVLIAVLQVLASSLTSFGNVAFSWLSGSSTVKNESNVNLASSSTVLNFISLDGVQNFDVGKALQSSYGDDLFIGSSRTLYTGRLTTSSATYGEAGAGVGSFVGSRLYAVVVNTPYFAGITPADIAIGARYTYTTFGYDSLNGTDLLVRHDTSPATADQTFTPTTLPVTTSLMNVPEPSSFALLGIGLGLVGLRRFRRK